MRWFMEYRRRLVAEMQEDPPWSGYHKLDALWPLFIGGILLFAVERVLDVTLHNTWWLVLFILPGVIWFIFFSWQYIQVFARRERSQGD